ncbi:MAG: DNA-3-methyladenine glycosylase 2 family protein [Thermomicrobiales bacterium]|nr:DNA-3-methyladenine glycosylase 2 family protein [Thermomicrobiales bacterium]MCA9880812.1 DNA-3-methyladenine glycosylase 2 family protein [Thermomicrobiales bacterium]
MHELTRDLPYQPPLPLAALLAFLGTRAVKGVEAIHEGVYWRTLRLPHGKGIVALGPPRDAANPSVACRLWLEDVRDEAAAIAHCRHLLDLDANPALVDAHLADDPLLGPYVRRTPGLRVPGAVDGAELAVRAILGQQVSVAGAATLAGRLVARYGEPLAEPMAAGDRLLGHTFPTPAALLTASPDSFSMPRSRVATLMGVCAALDTGEIVLAPEADLVETERKLLALRGIGPWTAAYIAMRALHDPDAFLPSDLGIKQAFARHGLPDNPRQIAAHAEAWRPWRAYANFHLWGSLAAPITER